MDTPTIGENIVLVLVINKISPHEVEPRDKAMVQKLNI